MKRLTITLVLICTIAFNTFSQTQSGTAQLLASYYAIKDALVKSNVAEVGTNATAFLAKVKAIDPKSLPESDQKAFAGLKEKLAFDAEHISESNDLDHQRDHFATLSVNFYNLAKTVKLGDQPIYQAYCPMKKMYWLSSEQAIKNPYYGKSMLTCGKITDTIK